MDRSPAVEDSIHKKIDELEQRFSHIMSCRVSVNFTSHRGNLGKLFEIHIVLTLPGKDISVSKASGHDHAHEDVYVAIRDAFSSALRMLDNRVEQMHDHRATNITLTMSGVVKRLFEEQGYGFIVTDDGKDVYFNKDSLTKSNWRELSVDQPVQFKQHEGDKGLYAMQISVKTE